MSGLAGVWNLDGRPIERPLIAAIGSRIAHRGEDHAGAWFRDDLAFAARVRRVTPQSVHERQPLIDLNGNALVFDQD